MYKLWRKIHLYSFGYFKWLSLLISLLMIIISITGILYNHHHDFKFLTSWRVPVEVVPDHFQERLEKTRALQGIPDMGEGQKQSVPLIWVVVDLHTGAFFGPLGRLFYDLIGVMFIVLAGSGIYLYWKRKR